MQMLLSAIRLTSARFIEERQLASCCAEVTDEGKSQVRDWVILQAMKRPSVESLQALIVLAFHDVSTTPQPRANFKPWMIPLTSHRLGAAMSP